MARVFWFVAMVLILGMTACKKDEATHDSDFNWPDLDQAIEPDEDTAEGEPDSDTAVAEQIKVLLNEHLTFTNGAGIAVGVENTVKKSVVTAAAGVTNVDSGAAMTPDLLFRIASITKTFVATATLRLTELQKIALTDKLEKWYPDYPEADRITVKMLLNHTSGISDYATSGTPEEVITASADMPRYFEPGADWAYSNTNYIFLGRIIEQVSGKTLAEFLRAEIIEKAELPSTGLEKDEGLPDGGVLAGGHLYEDDLLALYTDENPAWSDGGMVSSVADLAHFATRLYGGWLLATATMDQMLTFVSTGGEDIYGLGTLRYENEVLGVGYGHNGSLINFNGEMVYFPEIKTAIAIQTNYPISGDNRYLLDLLVNLLAKVDPAPVADDCAYTDLRPATPAGRYETVRFKGNMNDISATEPAIGAGYYYYSAGSGLDNLFCSEYAFRYDSGESHSVYLLEECPEVERYYTGEVKIRRVELTVPIAELMAAQTAGEELIEMTGLDYARMDYWYDTIAQRVTKRCTLEVPHIDQPARLSFCMQRNTDFSTGEEVRLFAYLPFAGDTAPEPQCTCYDDQGNTMVCMTIEEKFGCEVPTDYFSASGDSYAYYRFVGPINDPSVQVSEEGEIEHYFMTEGTFFEASSVQNFAMRADNGLGTEVLILQSFGDLKTLANNTYQFKASELIVPIQTLVDAKADETATLTGADDFYFSLHNYTQKIRGSEISYKKCFLAARDAADTEASLLPCYADNTDFAIGETVKLFGNMKLTADPASLGIYWPTTDDCLCFTADNTMLDCADFDEL